MQAEKRILDCWGMMFKSVDCRRKTFAGLVVLLLTSCGRDAEVLDRFSRSYSSFYGYQTDAWAASDGILFRFGAEPLGDLDTRASKADRDRLALNRHLVSDMFTELSKLIDNLDQTALDLMEAANAIHRQDYRNEALVVAKSARAVHANLVSIHHLLVARISIQQRLAPASLVIASDRQEAAKLEREIRERHSSLESDFRRSGAEFGTLKEKCGLKEYPVETHILVR